MIMKTKITIKNVELHDGKEFEGTNWKTPMQVIYTEKGLFIDNIKGKCFGRSNIMWEGIDWKQYIGQTVEILIVNCVGKKITSSIFKPVDTIEILTSNLGNHNKNCLNHNGAYPLFLLGEV